MSRSRPSDDGDAAIDATRATATRARSGTLVALLFVVGIASICFGLYSTIAAFDVFDQALPFKVYFCRAIVAIAIGVVAVQVGSHFAKDAL
ncbi:hypothetical protein [Paraburkholderia phosphatilytica]|uniref:hypothetical protein n=1 Tax=Paraburkholderia phosphatilytica TaxID=2282883 RepID=UPI001F0C73F6|nr:hypothetical protein [Paraburkholderia phosphatilytica]